MNHPYRIAEERPDYTLKVEDLPRKEVKPYSAPMDPATKMLWGGAAWLLIACIMLLITYPACSN